MQIVCRRCGELKNSEEFAIEKRNSKTGRTVSCKVCEKKRKLNDYIKNKSHYAKINKIYYINNADKIKAKERERNRLHADVNRSRVIKWQKDNPEKVRDKNRRWKLNNPEKHKLNSKNYRERNKHTKKWKLSASMRSGIRQSLSNGGKNRQHWEDLVGFTLEQLITHLERGFKEGMSWDNYGQWHIDHIIPIAVFNFSSPCDIDFKKCWCLKNLQPLWAIENMRKQDKLDRPFQPSLAMAV